MRCSSSSSRRTLQDVFRFDEEARDRADPRFVAQADHAQARGEAVRVPSEFDAKAQELSILTVQPDDLDVLKSVQFATRVPKVRALVARPAAIQAAIKVHFEGEAQAFGQVRNAAGGTGSGLAVERDKKKTLTYEQPTTSTPSPPPSRDTTFSLPPTKESAAGAAAGSESHRRTKHKTLGGAAPERRRATPAALGDGLAAVAAAERSAAAPRTRSSRCGLRTSSDGAGRADRLRRSARRSARPR